MAEGLSRRVAACGPPWNGPLLLSDLALDQLSSLRAIVCDVDGTLADSKVPCEPPMSRAIEALLDCVDVGLISGGRLELIESQVLAGLELTAERRERLHLLPACGTTYLRWRQERWTALYDHPLPQADVERARSVLRAVSLELGLWEPDPFGEVMENRGGQLTYSALGQLAPLVEKQAWDPDGSKKARLIALAQPHLPGLTVSAGKSTSIDVTAEGFDKSFGVAQMLRELGVEPADAVYFGDRLDPGGNDRAVLRTGVACVQVAGWRETLGALVALRRVLSGVTERPGHSATP